MKTKPHNKTAQYNLEGHKINNILMTTWYVVYACVAQYEVVPVSPSRPVCAAALLLFRTDHIYPGIILAYFPRANVSPINTTNLDDIILYKPYERILIKELKNMYA